MATTWAEQLVGLYDTTGAVISANLTPPVGTTWEIKKSHIVEMRTVCETLFTALYGSVPSGWAAFSDYQSGHSRRVFSSWTDSSFTYFYLSHIDDIRQVVNFLEDVSILSVTSWGTIVPLYDSAGEIINSATFTPIHINHIKNLRTALNFIENNSNAAYSIIDYAPAADNTFVNIVDVPYGKSKVVEIVGSSVTRYVANPSNGEHDFAHTDRLTTKLQFIDDNIGATYSNNGFISEQGRERIGWHFGVITFRNQLSGSYQAWKDPVLNSNGYTNPYFLVPWNMRYFGSSVYEDSYIKITGYGVGVRLISDLIGRTLGGGTLNARAWTVCRHSNVYNDNSLYSQTYSDWTQLYGYANAAHPNQFVSDFGETQLLVAASGNPCTPIDPSVFSWNQLKAREIIISETNTPFTILIRDNPPPEFVFGPQYCRMGVIMKAS